MPIWYRRRSYFCTVLDFFLGDFMTRWRGGDTARKRQQQRVKRKGPTFFVSLLLAKGLLLCSSYGSWMPLLYNRNCVAISTWWTCTRIITRTTLLTLMGTYACHLFLSHHHRPGLSLKKLNLLPTLGSHFLYFHTS